MPVGRWVIRTAESVVFTLCPPGPDDRNTSTFRSLVVDLHLDRLGLGHDQHPGGRGVDAALRLGDGHPLHAVHAALVLQPGPGALGALALHRDRRVLDAAQAGDGGVQDLGPPAAPFGVPLVHPEQVAGEQRGLLAALARLDLQEDVPVCRSGPAAPASGAARPRAPRGGRPAASPRLGEGGILPGQLARGLLVRRGLLPLADTHARSGSARRSGGPACEPSPGRSGRPGRRARAQAPRAR